MGASNTEPVYFFTLEFSNGGRLGRDFCGGREHDFSGGGRGTPFFNYRCIHKVNMYHMYKIQVLRFIW